MRRRDDGDDSLPVMVPHSDKVLVSKSAARVRRLREHLINALRELRTAKHQERIATPVRPEPTGFAAKVARTACSLARAGAAGTETTMPSWMTGRWRVCASPGRPWMSVPCCGCISISCRRSHTGTHASFTVNGAARWTGRYAPTFATVIIAAVSALT
jgi:hypothetical protein